MDWYIFYSPAALWGDLWGSLHRRCCIISVRSGPLVKLDFYAMSGRMGEIDLPMAGWDGRIGWGGGGMEVKLLVGARSLAPPLDLEVRRAA